MKSFRQLREEIQLDEGAGMDVWKHNYEMKFKPEMRTNQKLIPDDKVPMGYSKHPKTGFIEKTGVSEEDIDDHNRSMKTRPDGRDSTKFIPDNKVPNGYTKHPESGVIEKTGTKPSQSVSQTISGPARYGLGNDTDRNALRNRGYRSRVE